MPKRLAMVLTVLFTLGVGSVLGTSYISYNGSTQDESTTISSTNVSNGSAGAISWQGTSCTYSDNRVNISANGSITFSVSGENMITKIVVTSGSTSSNYGTWTSTSGSVSSSSGTTTISDINAASVTIKTSTAFRCTSASSIKIYYDAASSGGSGGGSSDLGDCNVTYDFTKIDGFSSWGSGYTTHTVSYADATVTFASANKQSNTITDQPVTKGGEVSLVMKEGNTLSSVTWVCTKWSDKSQTITLHYSTNGGSSYTTTGVTSTNFTISKDPLPAGTNAVKITFSSSKNQVGISSCSIEKVCTTETTITLDLDGGSFDSKPDGWEEDGNNYTKTVNSGDQVTLPEPNKTGHDFEGWYNASTKVTSPYTLTGNTTLTAHWTPQDYTITYKDQGDVAFSGTHENNHPTQHTYGTATTLKSATKSGYNFLGWFTTANCSSSAITQLGATDYTDDITLYAKWEVAKTATSLTWSAATYSATIDADNTFPILTKTPDDLTDVTYSSSNTGVATIDANTGEITLKADGTTTITATFTETATHTGATASYTLTVHPSNCRWVEIAIEDIKPEDEIVVTMGNDKTVYALGTEKIKNSPKSQEITITSGMIDINQDFTYSKYTWSISAVTGGYTLQPYGTTDTYLYGVKSYISIGNNNTNNVFTIFTSPENGNKCFMYTIEYTSYYLGHGTEDGQTAWKQFPNYTNLLKSNTLKFYKKTCLPANKFWIDYELANVTCTNTPPHSQIDQTGEDLLLEFSANGGYKLPETISVKMGETEIGNDENYCVWDKETGDLLIVGELITDNITITIEGCEQLAAPENLLATNITSTSAVLSWDAVAKADEYIVFVTDGETNLEIPTTNCTITIEGLSKNTYYLWDVTATADNYCDSKKPSVLTNEFTTLDVYTVTFNTDGGTDVAPQTLDHGGKATKPANPTKTGYTFAGWYTEADTEFNFNTPIESATTLYAKWNANQYTITLRQQWGSGGTETVTVHFNNNDFSVSPIIVPTRNGYTFGGYYTAASGAGTQLIDVSGAWLNAPTYIEGGKWVYADNLTLYAKWTQNFTITWMANGQLYHSQTAMMGTAIAKPDDPDVNEFACDDKVFVGWLDKTISGSTNEGPTFVTDFGTIQAAKTYHAVFATLTGTPSNDYNKITDINDLTDGEYVIAYSYDGGTQIVLDNTTKDATKMNASALAPSSNKYTSPNAEYIWQLQKQDDGSYYMYNSSVNKFLYATTSTLQLSDNPTKYTISYDNNYSHWKIKLSNNTSYYMHGYVSGSSYDFRVSTSGSNTRYRVYLYKNASTAVYSDYVTTCVEIPTPHWEGAEIDNANIAVNCGAISFKSNASKITFDKNYDLTYPITLTASEGFLLSTNKQNDIYEQSVTVTPVQSDDNKGKITQSVYVRADATGKNTNFDGTITISGDQLAEDQIIEVHAVVDCPQYTLTFNDCGDTRTISGFAGTSVEEMEPWAETCSEPFQYVFDGWATAPVTNGTEEYDKVDFSTYTMPNNNTTILYAVYRYAEEGGEPVNGYVKVTEALTDWSGDYVIVDDEFNVAIQNTYEEDTKDNKTLKDVSVTIENDKIVSPTNDIIWTISKFGEYYTVYNAEAIKYAGITKGATRAAGLSETIATGYSMNIIFDSNTKIAKVSSTDYNRCFSYSEAYPEWRTYSNNDANGKTGYLYRFSNKTIRYTSSLVCGTIEAEDALVTSTKDQKVKVKVPITLESSTGATTINATSDNAAFDVTGLTDVEEGDHTIVVEYTPAEYNITETANITLSATNGATATFTVSGRSLPENFVIATKVGATWYALPANMNGATNPEGVVIDVDETTMIATAPNTTIYTLFPVATINSEETDRYKEYGERLRFAAVNNGNKGLWANNSKEGTNINNYAAITAANSTAGAAYEWKITTTIVDGNWQYTLQTDQSNNQKYLRYWTAASGGAKWGTYASGNDKLYFLPVTTYTDLDLEVMEWGTNSMVIRAGEDLPQNVNITINGTKTPKTLQNINGSDLYKIDDVTLTSDDCGTIIIDNGSNARKIIRKPLLVSGNRSGSEYTTSPGRDICAECDIVILNGGQLIADEAKSTGSHVDFANIYVYPGGKLVLDGKSLGVKRQVYLRGGYSWINQTTYDLPEVYVNGDINFNGSGNIIYDYYIQNYKYYQFSLPYQVPLAKVTDEAGVDNFPVWVKHYNGALRAADANATSWEWYSGDNFEAGIGYIIAAKPRQEGKVANRPLSIIRFPLDNSVISSAEADKSIATTAHGIVAYNAGTITANNVGWNFIGNPFMATWKGDIGHQQLMKSPDAEHWNGSYHWENNAVKYITVMSPKDGTDYDQYIAANTKLKPFFPFYLQETADGGAGTINFAAANRIQKAPAELYADEPREAFVQVEILTDRVEDQTGVFISDTYSDDIDFDDYEKIFGSSLEKSKLWFIHEDKRMAFEAMTEASAAANIALGYRAPRLGKYTFAINEDVSALNEVVGVYLTDHELGVTDYNLLYNTYEFETEATNYNDQRFTIRITLRDDSNGVVTGVDNIGTMNDGIYKFIYQDKMYIYNDGIIYDATGKQVTNINK